MAKEFKDYDKKYAHLQNRILDGEILTETCYRVTEEKWPFKPSVWTKAQVRYAVYESDTADVWQQFRVSLKGCETPKKLARLYSRFIYGDNLNKVEKTLEKCRIDNYIGALVRGGQLNKGLWIVR